VFRRKGHFRLVTNFWSGLVLDWYRPPLNSSEDAKLTIRRFEGHLYFPGEFQGGVRIQPPRLTNEVEYKPTISRDGQLGWAQKMEASTKPTFLKGVDKRG
jgi:hypothetical protein